MERLLVEPPLRGRVERPRRATSLERGVDADVDQVRAAAGKRPTDRGGDLRRLLHTLPRDAERPRHADEVDERLEVHPDVPVVLGGEALERARALLEDPVRRVVEDDVDDRKRLAGGGPERLVRVHVAAVADEREDRPVPERELHTERRRKPPADAAAANAEEALRVGAAKKWRTPCAEENDSSTITAFAGARLASSWTSVSGWIGTRAASASARRASSARSLSQAARTAPRRRGASGWPSLLVRRRTASPSSGSVALGSPWIATAAG